MVCPRCGGTMKVIAFLTEHAVGDRIIDHLKLTFIATSPRRLRQTSKNIFWPPIHRLII